MRLFQVLQYHFVKSEGIYGMQIFSWFYLAGNVKDVCWKWSKTQWCQWESSHRLQEPIKHQCRCCDWRTGDIWEMSFLVRKTLWQLISVLRQHLHAKILNSLKQNNTWLLPIKCNKKCLQKTHQPNSSLVHNKSVNKILPSLTLVWER